MIPGHITNHTLVLAPPGDWDPLTEPGCGRLPIRIEVTTAGPLLRSAWLPTPEELARLNAGAPVLLGILGGMHPPVSLDVGDPPE